MNSDGRNGWATSFPVHNMEVSFDGVSLTLDINQAITRFSGNETKRKSRLADRLSVGSPTSLHLKTTGEIGDR